MKKDDRVYRNIPRNCEELFYVKIFSRLWGKKYLGLGMVLREIARGRKDVFLMSDLRMRPLRQD